VYEDKKIALERRALKWERCDVVERHERSSIIVCSIIRRIYAKGGKIDGCSKITANGDY
jgi:hypothetical protein